MLFRCLFLSRKNELLTCGIKISSFPLLNLTKINSKGKSSKNISFFIILFEFDSYKYFTLSFKAEQWTI